MSCLSCEGVRTPSGLLLSGVCVCDSSSLECFIYFDFLIDFTKILIAVTVCVFVCVCVGGGV